METYGCYITPNRAFPYHVESPFLNQQSDFFLRGLACFVTTEAN